MKRGTKRATNSKFENNFQSQLLFKRNKRYFDLEKLNTIEQEASVSKRKPLADDNHLTLKINASFMNSTIELTDKLTKNINTYKNRLTMSQSYLTVDQETDFSTQKRVRSFSMGKMTSREYHDKLRSKPTVDERLFNNYSEEKRNLNKTMDFSQRKGKVLDNRNKHMNDIYHQTQQLYQEYYFNKSIKKSKVNYKNQKKQKEGRVFYTQKRPQNKPATELSPKKVDDARKTVSKSQTNIEGFYMNSGRQMPCNLDMRQMNELTNYWKGQDEKIERKTVDYEIRKMKDDLVEERKEKVKRRKKKELDRNEVCEQKFLKFLRNSIK